MMNPKKIRPLALCIFRKEDKVFVSEGHDPKNNEIFYRPIGGGIEFGELGKDAVAREVREEIAAEITHIKSLGTLENLFTYNGTSGHELVLLYQADFIEPAFYDDIERQIVEDGKLISMGRWMPLKLFLDGKVPLYPDGTLELLKREWNLSGLTPLK